MLKQSLDFSNFYSPNTFTRYFDFELAKSSFTDKDVVNYVDSGISVLNKTIKQFNNLIIPNKLRVLINKFVDSIKLSTFHIYFNIITSAEISELNMQYYKKQRIPTDILSFPYHQPELWGEIFIDPVTASKKALKRGDSFTDYMKRLFVHGTLHLFYGKHSKEFEEIEGEILNKL